jgi:hypothetical protein
MRKEGGDGGQGHQESNLNQPSAKGKETVVFQRPRSAHSLYSAVKSPFNHAGRRGQSQSRSGTITNAWFPTTCATANAFFFLATPRDLVYENIVFRKMVKIRHFINKEASAT